MEKQIERMRKLSAMLQAASKAYYQEDKEIMSNLEYDRLYDELACTGKGDRDCAVRKPDGDGWL